MFKKRREEENKKENKRQDKTRQEKKRKEKGNGENQKSPPPPRPPRISYWTVSCRSWQNVCLLLLNNINNIICSEVFGVWKLSSGTKKLWGLHKEFFKKLTLVERLLAAHSLLYFMFVSLVKNFSMFFSCLLYNGITLFEFETEKSN